MAEQIEWTFNEYPGFIVIPIQHPNGLMTALMKRHGNPIARTKVPTDGETLQRWSRAHIRQVLLEEQKNDTKAK